MSKSSISRKEIKKLRRVHKEAFGNLIGKMNVRLQVIENEHTQAIRDLIINFQALERLLMKKCVFTEDEYKTAFKEAVEHAEKLQEEQKKAVAEQMAQLAATSTGAQTVVAEKGDVVEIQRDPSGKTKLTLVNPESKDGEHGTITDK